MRAVESLHLCQTHLANQNLDWTLCQFSTRAIFGNAVTVLLQELEEAETPKERAEEASRGGRV